MHTGQNSLALSAVKGALQVGQTRISSGSSGRSPDPASPPDFWASDMFGLSTSAAIRAFLIAWISPRPSIPRTLHPEEQIPAYGLFSGRECERPHPTYI